MASDTWLLSDQPSLAEMRLPAFPLPPFPGNEAPAGRGNLRTGLREYSAAKDSYASILRINRPHICYLVSNTFLRLFCTVSKFNVIIDIIS